VAACFEAIWAGSQRKLRKDATKKSNPEIGPDHKNVRLARFVCQRPIGL